MTNPTLKAPEIIPVCHFCEKELRIVGQRVYQLPMTEDSALLVTVIFCPNPECHEIINSFSLGLAQKGEAPTIDVAPASMLGPLLERLRSGKAS